MYPILYLLCLWQECRSNIPPSAWSTEMRTECHKPSRVLGDI
jgi:hypothetical protein